MDAWVPLLQSLVWPLFVGILLLLFRASVAGILRAVRDRIERGDPFEVDTRGFRMGPKLPATVEAAIGEAGGVRGFAKEASEGYERSLYLVHRTGRPQVDDDGEERRSVTVELDADSEGLLDRVDRVVYHLHPTFADPERVVTDRKNRFRLRTRVWGQFNLSADVYVRGADEPLGLTRYINF